ncbi:MAG: TadE/TadG family type IV pilus assembly protein [Lachnospiraceae bacterium]
MITPKSSIKEMSLPSFLHKFRKAGCDGSMAVEAALVLPLFLFFLLNLLWIIEIYSLHSTLKSSLREVGRELSVYAYAYDSIVQEEEDTGLEAFIENVAFSYLYVKGRVEDLAGADYLDASPLTYGREGLLYVESSILQQGDIIDLVVTYQVSPFIDIVGFFPGRFYTRYYGRAWTGYAVSGEGGENTGEEYVYVAENAEVYHLSRNCTHINLSIEECTSEEVAGLRNEDGSRYLPCELCVTDGQGRLYIARSGDRYHQKLECSGLKRTITVMLRSEAEKYYRMCSRCGK